MKKLLEMQAWATKKVQVYADPRSKQYRDNFSMIKSRLDFIKKTDPKLLSLKKFFPTIEEVEKKQRELNAPLSNDQII